MSLTPITGAGRMTDRTLELWRFGYTPMGTFGYLRLAEHGYRDVFTIERPWSSNQRNVSCIPTGMYDIEKRHYHRGGYDALELLNVVDRTYILIHVGNTVADVRGCIAVGLRLACMDGTRWGVGDSRAAFRELMTAYSEASPGFDRIHIRNVAGGQTVDHIDPLDEVFI